MRLAKYSSLLLLAAIPGLAASFQISVNATSLPANTSGFIDFTLNGGFPASAVISNFSDPGGSLNPATIFTQDASGSLPGSVTLGNNNSDYDEGITYGSRISFLVTFSETPGGKTGDVFNLSLFDTSFGGLLTGNINDGWIVQFQLDTAGNIIPDAFASPSGGPSLATATFVPEPATWSYLGALFVGVVFLRRFLPGGDIRNKT